MISLSGPISMTEWRKIRKKKRWIWNDFRHKLWLLTSRYDQWRFHRFRIKDTFGLSHEDVIFLLQMINLHSKGAFGDHIHGEIAKDSVQVRRWLLSFSIIRRTFGVKPNHRQEELTPLSRCFHWIGFCSWFSLTNLWSNRQSLTPSYHRQSQWGVNIDVSVSVNIKTRYSNLFDFSRRECGCETISNIPPFLASRDEDHFATVLARDAEGLHPTSAGTFAWWKRPGFNHRTSIITRRLTKWSKSLTITERIKSASAIKRFGVVPSKTPTILP